MLAVGTIHVSKPRRRLITWSGSKNRALLTWIILSLEIMVISTLESRSPQYLNQDYDHDHDQPAQISRPRFFNYWRTSSSANSKFSVALHSSVCKSTLASRRSTYSPPHPSPSHSDIRRNRHSLDVDISPTWVIFWNSTNSSAISGVDLTMYDVSTPSGDQRNPHSLGSDIREIRGIRSRRFSKEDYMRLSTGSSTGHHDSSKAIYQAGSLWMFSTA